MSFMWTLAPVGFVEMYRDPYSDCVGEAIGFRVIYTSLVSPADGVAGSDVAAV